jgi:hypothetical protein
MGLGGKIMAGIAVTVAAMVVKRYMKRREKEEKRKIKEVIKTNFDCWLSECDEKQIRLTVKKIHHVLFFGLAD